SLTPATGRPRTLTCTTNPKAATAGVDTFAGCRINVGGTAYQLHAVATSLTAADSAAFDITNPVPTTTIISPAIKAIGDAAFTMTVTGTNFVPGATVLFNGCARPSTYVRAKSLTVAIPATDMLRLGRYLITVVNTFQDGVL